jgi:hypothetical protein
VTSPVASVRFTPATTEGDVRKLGLQEDLILV